MASLLAYLVRKRIWMLVCNIMTILAFSVVIIFADFISVDNLYIIFFVIGFSVSSMLLVFSVVEEIFPPHRLRLLH